MDLAGRENEKTTKAVQGVRVLFLFCFFCKISGLFFDAKVMQKLWCFRNGSNCLSAACLMFLFPLWGTGG